MGRYDSGCENRCDLAGAVSHESGCAWGDREEGPVSTILRTAPLVWLGTVSYSLYMVHGLLFGRIFDALAFLQAGTSEPWVGAQLGGLDLILLPPLPATLLALAMLAALLPCAWLAWRLIEWPARQWSRRAAARYGAADEERAAPTI